MISKADIKYIVNLQLKKQRQKYGQFIVEGEKSITELLKSHFKIDIIYGTAEWISKHGKSARHIKTEEISEKELSTISVHQTPQQALAVVNIPDTIISKDDFNGNYSIALDNIQDPGNMGTIIRIADWYGIKSIICGKGCTDVYSPKCINSTMGSFTRVKVFYDDILNISEKYNQPIIASTLDGDNIHRIKEPLKGMIVIGNEGHGIDEAILKKAKHNIMIPRFGEAESLNAAVSTAIILDNLARLEPMV